MADINEILKRQKQRLKKIRASRKRKPAPKKPVAVHKPIQVAPPAPTHPKKITKRLKPLNGDSAWILTPLKISQMTLEDLIDGHKRDELRKMGRQYGIKGSAKSELAYELKEVADRLLSE